MVIVDHMVNYYMVLDNGILISLTCVQSCTFFYRYEALLHRPLVCICMESPTGVCLHYSSSLPSADDMLLIEAVGVGGLPPVYRNNANDVDRFVCGCSFEDSSRSIREQCRQCGYRLLCNL